MIISFPLPKDHWLYIEPTDIPEPPAPKGGDKVSYDDLVAVARYAIKGATMNGKIIDFDPDAMVQCFIAGMRGYDNVSTGLTNSEFESELSALLNRYSKENDSNTPDYILATFLNRCLTAFDNAVRQRSFYYTQEKK